MASALRSAILPSELYTVTFPGCPVPVTIPIPVVESLQKTVSATTEDQYGILFGEIRTAGTTVRRILPVDSFEVEAIRLAVSNANGNAVGLYHIRDGGLLELTAEELAIAYDIVPNSGSVVLLIERRPDISVANFVFNTGGSFLNMPLLEFPLHAPTLRGRRTHPEPEESGAAHGSPGIATQKMPQAKSSPSADPVSQKPRAASRDFPYKWVIPMVLAGAVLSYVLAIRFGASPKPPDASAAKAPTTRVEPTALHAQRQGEDLNITWDLDSPLASGVTSGVLDIDDGGARNRIQLTADQVRFGNVLYSPSSGHIAIELTTTKTDRSTAHASVLILLNKPAVSESDAGRKSNEAPFEVKETLNHKPSQPNVPSAPAMATKAFVPPPDRKQPLAETTMAIGEPSPVSLSFAPSTPPISAPEWSRLALPHDQPPLSVTDSKPAQDARRVQQGMQTPPSNVPVARPGTPAANYVAPVLTRQTAVRVPQELASTFRPVTIRVNADVSAAGTVTHVQAIPDKGIHSLLLRAAEDAARSCHFQAARRGNEPVAATVTMVFHVDASNPWPF